MLITISWKAGSGKWTVSRLLAAKLWYQHISIWDIKRDLAAQMWLNIIEFNKLGEQPGKEKEFDLKYEDYQRSLNPQDNILLDSRLWFYCQPDSFKVFLDVKDEVAASRIIWDHRATDKFSTLQDAIKETQNRNESDIQRYKHLYNIDFLDTSKFDLVIDTSDITAQQTVDQIISKLPNKS